MWYCAEGHPCGKHTILTACSIQFMNFKFLLSVKASLEKWSLSISFWCDYLLLFWIIIYLSQNHI